jgi:hypothetical protein
MLDRIIRLSCELPILFSNNLIRRRRYGRALFVLPASPHRRTTQRWGWTAKRTKPASDASHTRTYRGSCGSSPALEVSGLLGVSASGVLRVFGKGA